MQALRTSPTLTKPAFLGGTVTPSESKEVEKVGATSAAINATYIYPPKCKTDELEQTFQAVDEGMRGMEELVATQARPEDLIDLPVTDYMGRLSSRVPILQNRYG